MRIKIYDKSWSPLTTFFGGSVPDFNGLSYKSTLGEIGDASFTIRLDNAKCTEANIRHYNKVEITDDDDKVRWNGVIVQKRITFNLVEIRCYSLIHLFQKRITGDAEAYNDDANTVLSTLLSNTNGAEDTGIAEGDLTVSTNVQVTYNRTSVYDALKTIAAAAGGQYDVNLNRELDFKPVIGQDLSASIGFRYDLALLFNANIINFDVSDDGKDIVTKTYAKSDGFTSNEEDGSLTTLYGLHEQFKNFREVNDQTSLDNLTDNNNNGSEYSPEITLSPAVGDEFEIGDIVEVVLNNRLVNIDGNFQILEKSVKFKAGQKQISIKIISNTSDFFKKIKNLSSDVRLLSREV